MRGADCLQIFVSNPRAWAAPRYDEPQVERFRDALAASGLKPCVAHLSYVGNVASWDPTTLRRTRELLVGTVHACDALGVDLLVVHAGAGGPQDRDTALGAAAESFRLAVGEADRTRVLVELMAGTSGAVASATERGRGTRARRSAMNDSASASIPRTCSRRACPSTSPTGWRVSPRSSAHGRSTGDLPWSTRTTRCSSAAPGATVTPTSATGRSVRRAGGRWRTIRCSAPFPGCSRRPEMPIASGRTSPTCGASRLPSRLRRGRRSACGRRFRSAPADHRGLRASGRGRHPRRRDPGPSTRRPCSSSGNAGRR